MSKLTVPPIGLDRLTVKVNTLVPALPSLAVASEMTSEPLPTPLTEAGASRMPAPQPSGQAAGRLRALALMTLSTVAGADGDTDCIRATTPATCGADIEVPCERP